MKIRKRKREFRENLKRKIELNDGFYKGYYSKDGKGIYKYKGYYSKDGKGIYKVDNKHKYKNYIQKYMNRKYRRKKIDLEEVGYKGNYFKKGRYDIQWIIY